MSVRGQMLQSEEMFITFSYEELLSQGLGDSSAAQACKAITQIKRQAWWHMADPRDAEAETGKALMLCLPEHSLAELVSFKLGGRS